MSNETCCIQTFHHFIELLADTLAANLRREGFLQERVSIRETRPKHITDHLNALVTSGILKFGSHRKPKATRKSDASNYAQWVVAECFQRG